MEVIGTGRGGDRRQRAGRAAPHATVNKPRPFPIRFSRALIWAEVPSRLGLDVYSLLHVILEQQDRVFDDSKRDHYHGKRVDFWVKQLCALLGMPESSPKRLRNAIAEAVKDGWLIHDRPRNGERVAAVFQLRIPERFRTQPKKISSDATEQSTPIQNDRGTDMKGTTPVKSTPGNPGQNDQGGVATPVILTPPTPVILDSPPRSNQTVDPGHFEPPSYPIHSLPNSSSPSDGGGGGGIQEVDMKDLHLESETAATNLPSHVAIGELLVYGVNQAENLFCAMKDAGGTAERIRELIGIAQTAGRVGRTNNSEWRISPEALAMRIKHDISLLRHGCPLGDPWESWVDDATQALTRVQANKKRASQTQSKQVPSTLPPSGDSGSKIKEWREETYGPFVDSLEKDSYLELVAAMLPAALRPAAIGKIPPVGLARIQLLACLAKADEAGSDILRAARTQVNLAN